MRGRCVGVFAHAVLLTAALAAPAGAQPAGRALTADEWRADIRQMAKAIRDIHPAPFRKFPAADFDAAVERLLADAKAKSDKQIIVDMARIVAKLEDGHSRLSLPRQHPEFGVVQGHTGTADPRHASLAFSDLPVKLERFSDGFIIVAAAEPHSDLIGAQVLEIGRVTADSAASAVRQVIFADNAMGATMLMPDRLTMPELLALLGLADDPARTRLRIARPGGAARDVVLEALPPGEVHVTQQIPASAPFATPRYGVRKWHGRVPDADAWYIRFDEFEEFPDQPLAGFMRDAIAEASRAGAERLVLDLRDNQGGTGQWNRGIIAALAESPFNRYGLLYVLIGRRTYSAAQFLVNELEVATEAIFAGEPTGASPSQYGDPRKIVLEHSGLTLRVSTIFWHAPLAGEFRTATEPHLDAALASRDFYAGRDPALAAALAFRAPTGVAAQVEDLFRRGKTQQAVLRFVGFLSNPRVPSHDIAADMIATGDRLLADGKTREGYFSMVLASDYYPRDAATFEGLGRALEKRDDPAAARRAYEKALKIEPGRAGASAALARLGPAAK
jgi:hypothetical protein